MIALLGVEVRRIFARRLVRLFLLLVLAGIVTAGLVTFLVTDDVGQASRAASEQRSEFLDECLSFEEDAFDKSIGDPHSPQRSAFCEQQDFGGDDPVFRISEMPDTLRVTTVFAVIISWLLAASFIGAEWRAGTMTTTLTWEPRRARLLVTKALAAVIFATAFTIVAQALLAGALSPTALVKGTTEGGADAVRESAGVILRGAVLASVGALVGFSVGHIGRNTAVALGAGFVYLAILEGGIVGGIFPGIRQWLVVGNSIVFIGGPTFEVSGRSVTEAGILLTVYGLGALAIATAFFRARDVS